MMSTQSMTVSRHDQSVRSAHRRGTYRKSGFVIGRYGNTIPRCNAVHCTLSHPSSRSTLSLIPREVHPHHCPSTFTKGAPSPRISARRPPQRRVSLCISSRRAACRLRSAWNFIFGSLRFHRWEKSWAANTANWLPSSPLYRDQTSVRCTLIFPFPR